MTHGRGSPARDFKLGPPFIDKCGRWIGGVGGWGVDLWRIKNGGLRFGKLQGAEFRFRELGLPGSRLLKNGEQQVDFALGKWRAQKLK